jgi:condensin complex subunit 2
MSASSSSLNGHSAPLNDDKAEKANRRKSAHFGPLVEDGPAVQAAQSRSASGAAVLLGTSSTASVGGVAAGQQKRHVSALQAQGRRKRLSAVNPDMPVISLEERQGNFEEWMKLATDNVRPILPSAFSVQGEAVAGLRGKDRRLIAMLILQKITANNTWNFALIDYFADMTLLRNGPDDQSAYIRNKDSGLDRAGVADE